jgi:hypothetical protein
LGLGTSVMRLRTLRNKGVLPGCPLNELKLFLSVNLTPCSLMNSISKGAQSVNNLF